MHRARESNPARRIESPASRPLDERGTSRGHEKRPGRRCEILQLSKIGEAGGFKKIGKLDSNQHRRVQSPSAFRLDDFRMSGMDKG